MKNIAYITAIFTLFCLFSCDQQKSSSSSVQKDNRPKDELALVKVLGDADSLYSIQHNEITKTEVYDTSKIKISNFIIKDLNAKAQNWEATMHTIEVDELDGAIDVSLMIRKGAAFDEKFPEYNAIILKAHIFDNDKIKNMLKPLQKGDHVLITGTFSIEKDLKGNLKFEAFSIGSTDKEDELTNPAFDFIISDIKKVKAK